jgi:polar amino acid transport system permease protein
MPELNFGAVLQGRYLDWMIAGAYKTLLLFLAAWVTGFLIGLIVVSLRESRMKPLELIAKAFVGYHRNIPGLVQVFIWYFGIPQILPDSWQNWANDHGSEFLLVWIALSLNAGAYMSEDLRSGVRSLPPTQLEAARALGMSFVQAMRVVILPQALRVAIPPLTNQSLALFKSTSLAMAIGLAEMTYAAHQVENESFRTFEVFAIASAFYWICSFVLMGLGHGVHRRSRTLQRFFHHQKNQVAP